LEKHPSIVATIDNQSQVMDVFGGRVVNRSRGAFSACEKYVILSFGSHVAGIYDLKGNLLKEITAHEAGSYINAIAISPEGNYVLTASQDSTAALWMLNGQILARLKHPNWVTAVAFSHDSKYILTGCRSGAIKLWDIDGIPLKTFPQKHQVQITHLGFSEDNKNIWSFSDSGMRVLRVTDPEGIQYTLTDGGTSDHFLHEWSIRGEHLNSHDFNRELAVRYTFSNDFKHVMVGYNNTNAQLLNQSGHLLQNLFDHKGNLRAMAMSPDRETIVTLDNHGVYFWEPKTAYEVFLKTGTYKPLSEPDKTAFGIATTQ
jgi:WD40 repeat protein